MRVLQIPRSSRMFHAGLGLGLLLALLALSLNVADAQAVLPDGKTKQAEDIRSLYFLVFGVAVGVFLAVEIGIFYLAIRYRRRNNELPPQIHGNHKLEVVWTLIPTVIVIILFGVSLTVLEDIESAPDEGTPVEVIDVLGRQWAWTFNYGTATGASTTAAMTRAPHETEVEVSDGTVFRRFMTIRVDVEHMRVSAINGNILTVDRGVDGTVLQDHVADQPIDRLFNGTEFRQEERLGGLTPTPVVTVPVGRTVRLDLASLDVIHSFYTAAFLTKLDANPGRVQSLWLDVTEPGIYQGQCAEFCGREHARMLFTVQALPLDEYDVWLAEITPPLGEETAPPLANGGETPPNGEATRGNPAHGQELFFANGCNVCHGDQGQGGIGPTLASTNFSLDDVIAQYRNPRGIMPTFTADRVPDTDVADIYAWLQTLPLPAAIVPGLGTP